MEVKFLNRLYSALLDFLIVCILSSVYFSTAFAILNKPLDEGLTYGEIVGTLDIPLLDEFYAILIVMSIYFLYSWFNFFCLKGNSLPNRILGIEQCQLDVKLPLTKRALFYILNSLTLGVLFLVFKNVSLKLFGFLLKNK